MHPQIKQTWIEALRGRQYRQGFGTLAQEYPDGMRHCALGVLLDLIDQHHEWSWQFGHATRNASQTLQLTGLSGEQLRLIAVLNDRGTPFSEIADVIERDLESETALQVTVNTMIEAIATRALARKLDPSFVTFMKMADFSQWTASGAIKFEIPQQLPEVHFTA